ncbi:MAG: carboxylesterase [Sulfitobacter sp. SK025]|nr:MAG: carboxylesterase [Sulfitobacter sp. SK025]
MGMIEKILGLVFGGGGNIVRDTVEVFRENTEAGAQRAASAQNQAMTQYASEYGTASRGRFDRFMDGLNRLPRPALALGTLGMFVAAMIDPIWFASRMQGVSLVPEPLWWLLGVVVSFYFGARHQIKTQEFQRSIARTIANAPQVAQTIQSIQAMRLDVQDSAAIEHDAPLRPSGGQPSANPALEDWRKAAL